VIEGKNLSFLALLLPFGSFFLIIRVMFYPLLLLEEAVMKKILFLLALVLIVGIGVSACGGATGGDLLDEVKDRGYMVVSTDPNYAPQSSLDPDAVRVADTVCPSDMLTYGEMVGFDVDVAYEVAKALGVDVCFATPDWDVVTAGSWGDRWDVSIGSMAIKENRQKVLHFTSPYYYTPGQFAAAADTGFETLDDLVGETVCVAAATTYLDWLLGDTGFPAEQIFADPPADIEIVEVPTDQECAQAIAAGRPEYSVYITSDTVINSNIANGLDVVKVGPVVFLEKLAASIDKSSSYDTASFVTAVDNAIKGLHANGTLSTLALKWFDGLDLSKNPLED
jgi:polar amino acid transport system substrate-binding protein